MTTSTRGAAEVPAVLVLEDGRTFRGRAYGAVGETFGEAVFSTGMTGYQETLTDPSYDRQIVVATAPQIGNTGWNDEDDESSRIWVSGYVVRDPARVPSNWRAKRSLDDELERRSGRKRARTQDQDIGLEDVEYFGRCSFVSGIERQNFDARDLLDQLPKRILLSRHREHTRLITDSEFHNPPADPSASTDDNHLLTC